MIDVDRIRNITQSAQKCRERIADLEKKVTISRESLTNTQVLELIENIQLLKEVREDLVRHKRDLDTIIDDPSNYVGCTYR